MLFRLVIVFLQKSKRLLYIVLIKTFREVNNKLLQISLRL